MIDWLTLRLPYELIPDDVLPSLLQYGDRIVRFNAKTGEQVWETSAWDSVASDSHQVVCRMGASGFWLQGSPARCMGDGANVFGFAPVYDDIVACARAMISTITSVVGVALPDVYKWKCLRVDYTLNYVMASLAEVRQVLQYLRGVEGGRYRVSQQAGDTVYWSHRSHLRSGKAYAKGPQIRYLAKNKDGVEMSYNEEALLLLDRLLRLELSLKSQYWRERTPLPWYEYTPEMLRGLHSDYFERMVGDVTVPETDYDMLKHLEAFAPSPQVARSVFRTFVSIRHEGYETVRETMSRPTWYRHRKILRDAGLGDIDLASGTVVPLRRRRLELSQPCESWGALRQACA